MLLHERHCSTDSTPQLLNKEDLNKYLKEVSNWDYSQEKQLISRSFKFKNYYQTLAFVNAAAWIIHQQNHHPNIEIGYNKCHVSFTTHSAGGITIFDFICAARINQLQQER